MQIHKTFFTFVTLFSLFGIVSCGGSPSNNTVTTTVPKQVIDPVTTPTVIDDIS